MYHQIRHHQPPVFAKHTILITKFQDKNFNIIIARVLIILKPLPLETKNKKKMLFFLFKPFCFPFN